MEIFETLYREVVGFFGIDQAWEILKSGNYSALATYDGIVAFVRPIIPLLILLEFILGMIYKQPRSKVYKVNFLFYVFNRFIGRFIAIAMVALVIGLLEKHALLHTQPTRYWFI